MGYRENEREVSEGERQGKTIGRENETYREGKKRKAAGGFRESDRGG